MMKLRNGLKILFFLLIAGKAGWAQTVVVTDDESVTTGDASSVLDVHSVSKGFLAPRMTETQRTAISSPATGLLVYQTNNIAGYYYYDGSAWQVIARGTGWTATGSDIYYNTGNVGIGNTSPTQALDVTGNVKFSGALMPNNQSGNSADLLTSAGAGTPPTWVNPENYLNGYSWGLDGNILTGAKNFGTASNHDLPFITNNTEKMRLTTSGRLGLGINAPTAPFHLRSAGTTTGVSPLAIFEETRDAGLSNGVVFQVGNRSAGSNRTLFILGSTVSSKQWMMGTDALGDNSQNFYLYDANATLVRMYIDGSNGYTGLGTSTPQSVFHVKATTTPGPTLSVGLFEGDADPGNYISMQLQNSSAANSKTGLIFGGQFSNQWMIGNDLQADNSQNFYIYDQSSFNTRLYIDQDGHTGLGGNITPTEALDVTGNIKFSGAVTGGSWNGSIISGQYGGTGVNNGSKTITLQGDLATAGTNNLTFTTTGNTNVTLPTSGTLVNTAVATLPSLTSAPVLSTVGTITSGTWNATVINPTYGGTGVNNGSNTITLSGNLTVSAAANIAGNLSVASGKTLTSSNTLTFTGTDGTSFALPSTSGNVVTTTVSSFEQTALKIKGGSSNTLTLKPNETLSANRTLNLLVGAADRTLNMGGNLTVSGAGTLSLASGKTLTASNTLTFTGTDGTSFAFPSTSGTMVTTTVSSFEQSSFKIKGGSSNTLTIKPNETLSAPRTLNLLVGAADRTLNMGGDLTVSGAGTLSIASGKTLTASNTITLAGPDGGSYTLPASGTLVNTAVTTLSSLASTPVLATVGNITTGTWNATTIAANKGGTGMSSYTLGDMLYASGGSTLGTVTGNTTTIKKYLSQTGTGSASAQPAWAQVHTNDISNIIKTSVTISNTTTVSASNPLELDVTVTGAQVNSSVIVNPRENLTSRLFIEYCFVPAADTVRIIFGTTNGSIQLGNNKDFDITIINP